MSRREEEGNLETLPASNPGAATTRDSAVSARAATAEGAPPLPELQAGESLGRYLLVERLGAGAMGVVWVARDPRLDRRVAIKVVHPRHARTPDVTARLLREARAMAKLSHRAVVTVHDADEVDGRLYIAMELVEGTTLGAILRNRSPDDLGPWRKSLAMLIDAGHGLAAAHRQGVLHRDFKPDNVLVDHAGRVCVADFGLATLGHDVHGDSTKSPRDSIPIDLTQTGALLGTPAYMSPQQLRGEHIDERADQFAFCVTAWETLYGKRPFTTTNTGLAALADLAESIASGVRPPPDSQVPLAVADALVRGLDADPANRWPDMNALVAALTEAAADKPRAASVSRAPTTSTTRVVSAAAAAAAAEATAATVAIERRRRKGLWVGVAALAAVALVLAIVLATKARETSSPTPVVPSNALAGSGVTSSAASSAARAQDKQLFKVTLRARLAISGDGKRIALGGSRLEVRDADGTGYWSTTLPTQSEIAGLEIEGDVLHFGQKHHPGHWQWRYLTDEAPVVVNNPHLRDNAQWYGSTIRGDLFLVHEPGHATLRIYDKTRELDRWDIVSNAEMIRVSPDHTRVAYFDGRRFTQKLVLRDLATGREDTIGPSPAFTAVAWQDNSTLLYAMGTVERPQIWSVPVSADGFGKPQMVHELETGWIATLAASPDRVIYVEMGLTSRTRVIERPALGTQDFDIAAVAAPLAWTANDELLVWNRSSKRLELQALKTPRGSTKIVLPREPANATLVGDLLIVSLRSNDGRTTHAYSQSTGELKWKHDDDQTFAVRCAGDHHPPCFAIRIGHGPDKIVHIDPTTGTLGGVIYETERLEDIAIDDTGKRMTVASTGTGALYELDLTAPQKKPRARPIKTVTGTRSVAYDQDGTVLFTGTITRNSYQAGHLAPDNTMTVLVQSENDILSMIRSSPDGKRVLLLSRMYAPALWQANLRPR